MGTLYLIAFHDVNYLFIFLFNYLPLLDPNLARELEKTMMFLPAAPLLFDCPLPKLEPCSGRSSEQQMAFVTFRGVNRIVHAQYLSVYSTTVYIREHMSITVFIAYFLLL